MLQRHSILWLWLFVPAVATAPAQGLAHAICCNLLPPPPLFVSHYFWDSLVCPGPLTPFIILGTLDSLVFVLSMYQCSTAINNLGFGTVIKRSTLRPSSTTTTTTSILFLNALRVELHGMYCEAGRMCLLISTSPY